MDSFLHPKRYSSAQLLIWHKGEVLYDRIRVHRPRFANVATLRRHVVFPLRLLSLVAPWWHFPLADEKVIHQVCRGYYAGETEWQIICATLRACLWAQTPGCCGLQQY